MAGRHGCGTTLRNNGNDGSVMTEELEDGTVEIKVQGTPATVACILLWVNGELMRVES